MPWRKQLSQRQLDTGPAAWFRPEPMEPPANQIRVKAGFLFAGDLGVYAPNPDVNGFPQDQLTAGFSVITPGNKRYDLVYLDATGVVQVLPGTQVAAATPGFAGAPGQSTGPALPDRCVPVAYVKVDEPATVIASPADVTAITGFIRTQRELDGYFVDKGSLGAAPTGSSSVVTGLFVGEDPNGNASAPFAAGVITVATLNVVHLLDQTKDEIIHAATGARIFGRLTFAALVWTLTYKYIDAAGVEQTVGNIATDCSLVPTNVQLVGVPKIYSKNDPTRPMFAAPQIGVSDQVVGEIPTATTVLQGKVIAATGSPNPPQAGAINEALSVGLPVGGGPFYRISFPAGGVTGAGGVLTVNATGPPGPTGPGGPSGPSGGPGPPGPTGPGFSSYYSNNVLYNVATVGPTSGSTGFSPGFNWRMGSAGCNLAGTATGHAGFYITSVSGVGSGTLTVNWVEQGGAVVGQTVGINAEAAG